MLSTQFDAEIQYSDVAFVAIELGLILVEVFADQQQWRKSPLLLKHRIIQKCSLTLELSSFPERKEGIPGVRQGASRLEAGRPRSGLCHNWALGIQQAP